MYILPVLVAVVVLGLAAMVSVGRFGSMAAEPVRDVFTPDEPADRMIEADDLDRMRFSSSARGYDMEQVDSMISRLGREVGERDRELGEWRAGRTPQPAVLDPAPGTQQEDTRGERSRPNEPVSTTERAARWRGATSTDDQAEIDELPEELRD